MTITGGRQHEDWPGIMKAQKSAGPQSATHTLMVKSSLSTARSGVNARWCRAQHTAPTASELPSISCPTQWARCHHLRSQHFVRGSPQNEQGCDTHPQCPSGEKRRKLIFVDSLSYVVHETRLVESFRLRPRDSKTVNHSGRDSRFRELLSKWRFRPRHMTGGRP